MNERTKERMDGRTDDDDDDNDEDDDDGVYRCDSGKVVESLTSPTRCSAAPRTSIGKLSVTSREHCQQLLNSPWSTTLPRQLARRTAPVNGQDVFCARVVFLMVHPSYTLHINNNILSRSVVVSAKEVMLRLCK